MKLARKERRGDVIGEAISVLEGLFLLKRQVDRNCGQMWLCGAGDHSHNLVGEGEFVSSFAHISTIIACSCRVAESLLPTAQRLQAGSHGTMPCWLECGRGGRGRWAKTRKVTWLRHSLQALTNRLGSHVQRTRRPLALRRWRRSNRMRDTLESDKMYSPLASHHRAHLLPHASSAEPFSLFYSRDFIRNDESSANSSIDDSLPCTRSVSQTSQTPPT